MIDEKLQLMLFPGRTRRVEYIKVCLPEFFSMFSWAFVFGNPMLFESFHVTICPLRLFICRQRIAYLHNNFWYWVSWLAILNHIWWTACFIGCVSRMQYCILHSKLLFFGLIIWTLKRLLISKTFSLYWYPILLGIYLKSFDLLTTESIYTKAWMCRNLDGACKSTSVSLYICGKRMGAASRVIMI
jgi:hypothetical protein